MTMARTDPRTLEAAFIAQAHSTALSPVSRSGCSIPELTTGNSGAGALARARRPVGKGIPIAKPSGTNSAALTNSLAMNGSPTNVLRIVGRTNT